MRTFNYKIMKGHSTIFRNTIHSPTRSAALEELEEVRREYDGDTIRIAEVSPASEWSC